MQCTCDVCRLIQRLQDPKYWEEIRIACHFQEDDYEGFVEHWKSQLAPECNL